MKFKWRECFIGEIDFPDSKVGGACFGRHDGGFRRQVGDFASLVLVDVERI